MKNIIFLCLTILIGACNNRGTSENDKVKLENDSLKNLLNTHKGILEEYNNSFQNISDNLKTIKEREEIITVTINKSGELSGGAEGQINDDIKLIYKLMSDNKKVIARLNSQLKSLKGDNKELKTLILGLEMQLLEKDKEIEQLKGDLTHLNIELADLKYFSESLNIELQKTEENLSEKIEELNRAYYAYGTKKELKKNNILGKNDKLLAIGGLKIETDNFNKDYFTVIDITKIDKIPFYSPRVKLISSHSKDSYALEIENGQKVLIIKDSKKFWSLTKYMIAQVQ